MGKVWDTEELVVRRRCFGRWFLESVRKRKEAGAELFAQAQFENTRDLIGLTAQVRCVFPGRRGAVVMNLGPSSVCAFKGTVFS